MKKNLNQKVANVNPLQDDVLSIFAKPNAANTQVLFNLMGSPKEPPFGKFLSPQETDVASFANGIVFLSKEGSVP